ncbi:unnamed protein product, partial [Polarella glacialis]
AYDVQTVGSLLVQTLLRQFEEAAGDKDELFLGSACYEAASRVFKDAGFEEASSSTIPGLET